MNKGIERTFDLLFPVICYAIANFILPIQITVSGILDFEDRMMDV